MDTQTPQERRDLFLSYRRLDAERVAPLVAALNARGVTVWQDANEIDDLASIQHAIDNGLANARALLVWYSKDYNASRAYQPGVDAGAHQAAQAVRPVAHGRTRPVRRGIGGSNRRPSSTPMSCIRGSRRMSHSGAR